MKKDSLGRKIMNFDKPTANKLTEYQKGFISGFIDADGSIVFIGKKKDRPIIKIKNTNKEVLEYIKKILNCGKIRNYTKTSAGNKAYNLLISKITDVCIILKQLFLIVKKDKQMIALKNLKEYEDNFKLKFSDSVEGLFYPCDESP